MITNSLYFASVVKLVIQESTALTLNVVFANKRVICRMYVVETIAKETISKKLMKQEDVSASLTEIVVEVDPKTSEKLKDLSTGNVNTSMNVQEDQGRKR